MGSASIHRNPGQLSWRKSRATHHSFAHLAIKLSSKSIFWPNKVWCQCSASPPPVELCVREMRVFLSQRPWMGMVESCRAFRLKTDIRTCRGTAAFSYLKIAWGLAPPASRPFLWTLADEIKRLGFVGLSFPTCLTRSYT